MLTGDHVPAEEALRIGLVQILCDDEALDSAALDLAERIAANAPIASQATKELVRRSEEMAIEAGMRWQADLQAYCLGTDDAKEGISAYKEKRRPNFVGH